MDTLAHSRHSWTFGEGLFYGDLFFSLHWALCRAEVAWGALAHPYTQKKHSENYYSPWKMVLSRPFYILWERPILRVCTRFKRGYSKIAQGGTTNLPFFCYQCICHMIFLGSSLWARIFYGASRNWRWCLWPIFCLGSNTMTFGDGIMENLRVPTSHKCHVSPSFGGESYPSRRAWIPPGGGGVCLAAWGITIQATPCLIPLAAWSMGD